MSNRLVEAASGLAAARPSEHWYAVCCKPHHEENLLRQGYRVYLPRIRNAHHRGGQWLDKVEPLFPRYLFIRVDPGRRSTAPVRSTCGVTVLVRYCGLPRQPGTSDRSDHAARRLRFAP